MEYLALVERISCCLFIALTDVYNLRHELTFRIQFEQDFYSLLYGIRKNSFTFLILCSIEPLLLFTH